MEKRRADESLEAFLERLADETAHSFRRPTDADGIRALVFLHVNRAREAKATLKQSAGALGVALARAGVPPAVGERAYDELEAFGPMLGAQYDAP